jgi:hypothetical protein
MRLDGTRRRRHRRRAPRRPLVLPLVLCAGTQAPAVVAQGGRSGAFAVQLARRLAGVHPAVLEALALERPQWRTARLLELGAELTDSLEAYAGGLAGESVVRTAALAVAAEAAAVWASTCGLPLDAGVGS